MSDASVKNFVVIDSVHGKFLVNRHCAFQAEALIKTGAPHIERELRTIRQVVATLPQGAVAVDAGANIGLVSVPLASWLKPRGGTVLAFEPQRMLFYALCGAAALNDLDNLQVRNQALGKRSLAALLPACTGIVLSPSKLWGFEPALWSTLLTTRRVACIAGWRS